MPSSAMWCYVVAYVLACATALVLVLHQPQHFSFTTAAYRRFLFVPWKLATFAVAAAGLILIAPYTGDPTWDAVDAGFMSVLTFLGAPWSVGTLYLWLRRSSSGRCLYVAAVLWMFSASWSYDLYLLLRDGSYPETWLANIFASGVLYCCGGLMWNLDWRVGRGITFAFLEPCWLQPPTGTFTHIVWYALPFMLLVSVAILSFVW